MLPEVTPPVAPPVVPPVADPPVPPAADPTPEPLDAAGTAHELAEARKEAARYRTDLNKLQAAQKIADDAKLSDDEKRAKASAERETKLTEREAALTKRAVEVAVLDAATRLGAGKPALVHRLIAGEIEFNEAGEPTNIDVLIKDFLKANPEFVSTAGHPNGDAGQGARGKSTLTTADIKKMKPAEINARWAEVSEVLGRGA